MNIFRLMAMSMLILIGLGVTFGCTTSSAPRVDLEEDVAETAVVRPTLESTTISPTSTKTATPTILPSATPISLAEMYQNYFNAHDLNGLLTLYTDDVICNNCGGPSTRIEGKEALRALLANEMVYQPSVVLKDCQEAGNTLNCALTIENEWFEAAGLEQKVDTTVMFFLTDGRIHMESHTLENTTARQVSQIWNAFYPWVTAVYPDKATQLYDENHN